jgi:hypothetical protein
MRRFVVAAALKMRDGEPVIGDSRVYPQYKRKGALLAMNNQIPIVCAFFATFMGFGLIWHIWWMVALAALGGYATFVAFAWRDRGEYLIPADEVARIDRANRRARSAAFVHAEAAP